jgi:hypothetical protein
MPIPANPVSLRLCASAVNELMYSGLFPTVQLKKSRAVQRILRIVAVGCVEINVESIANGFEHVARAAVIRSQRRAQQGSALHVLLALEKIAAVGQYLAAVKNILLRILPLTRACEFVGIEIDLHQTTPETTVVRG